MTTDFNSVRKLYRWNKLVLSMGGMWPLDASFVKFYIGYVYFAFHMILSISDFVSVFGDTADMIANLAETSIQIMISIKMLVIRHSTSLKNIIKQVEDALKEENYNDDTEKRLYLEYNVIGRTFFRIGSYFALAADSLYLLKPFEDIIKSVLHNETMPYVLPYRMSQFFDIPDARTYVLVYISRFPIFYYYYFHTASVTFFCTLVVHIAGETSVFAHRVRSINKFDSNNEHWNLEVEFRNVTISHRKIIRTTKEIDDIFNVVLLEELVISTILIGLTAYSVLSKSAMVSMVEFLFFVSYSLALFVLILVYCMTGDLLIRESENVQNAFYECRWYAMPSKYKKYILIFMARAQKPLQVTAGRFYVFSLDRFSSILKTSMAYISMLRTVV